MVLNTRVLGHGLLTSISLWKSDRKNFSFLVKCTNFNFLPSHSIALRHWTSYFASEMFLLINNLEIIIMLSQKGHWKIKWNAVIGVLTKLGDILKLLLKSRKILECILKYFLCELRLREKCDGLCLFCFFVTLQYYDMVHNCCVTMQPS